MTFRLTDAGVQSILLDIEGTTTPISFVYDVLFPFARLHVKSYLEEHFARAQVQADLDLLRQEYRVDLQQTPPPPEIISGTRNDEIESFVAYVYWLMDRDRKSTGLKSLQGRIWKQGYKDGALKAEVFPDVPAALVRWHAAGMKLGIFSSGSVLAQKLLFSHTNFGDLSAFLDHYFDTTSGAKNRADSYRTISAAVGVKPASFLFISDVGAELEAAHEAGMKILLCMRPGNHPQGSGISQTIDSFDEVF